MRCFVLKRRYCEPWHNKPVTMNLPDRKVSGLFRSDSPRNTVPHDEEKIICNNAGSLTGSNPQNDTLGTAEKADFASKKGSLCSNH